MFPTKLLYSSLLSADWFMLRYSPPVGREKERRKILFFGGFFILEHTENQFVGLKLFSSIASAAAFKLIRNFIETAITS